MNPHREGIANVGTLLSERARISPELEAIVDIATGDRVTFRALNERTNRIAALLTVRTEPGDRVALLAANGHWYAEIVFAAAKLGLVLVPLNWRLAVPELDYQIADCDPRLIIHDSANSNLAEPLKERHSQRGWLCIDAGTGSLSELVLDSDVTEPAPKAGKSDGWLILYTSGTTGRPKGAVHTHGSSLAWCQSSIASFEGRFADRHLLVAPMFHIAGICLLLNCAHRGFTSIVAAGFDPGEVWRLFQEEAINSMFAVPAMINMMREHPNRSRYSHDHLRWIMVGAAPVPVTLIDAYAEIGIDIHQVYGSTETHGGIAILPPAYAHTKKGSTGLPCFGVELMVVDREGRPVPPHENGELIARGPFLFERYWNLPDETERSFVDGWFHLGDIADVDEEGFITIRDRSKDMIISGGENVYPAEVEDVLLRHEQVLEVAVIGEANEQWGETPVAVVVRKDTARMPENSHSEELALLCSENLSRYKQPKRYVYTETLPRNASGKVLKHVLREQFCPKGDRAG